MFDIFLALASCQLVSLNYLNILVIVATLTILFLLFLHVQDRLDHDIVITTGRKKCLTGEKIELLI